MENLVRKMVMEILPESLELTVHQTRLRKVGLQSWLQGQLRAINSQPARNLERVYCFARAYYDFRFAVKDKDIISL